MSLDGPATSALAAILAEPVPMINRPSTVYALSASFLAFAWVCVGFRLYTRFFVVRSPGLDDFFVGMYLIFATIGSISVCFAVRYGMGQHFVLLSTADQQGYQKTFYIGNACYASTTAFIKISLLCQYLRIFERGTALRLACLVVIAFVALWGSAYSFIAWVPCFPVSQFWAPVTDLNRMCYGFGSLDVTQFVATFESQAGSNMVLDLIVLTLPVPLYFRRGTALKTKLGLVALMLMGLIVIFLSTWRLQTIVAHKAGTWPIRDPTWYGPITITLTLLEVDLAAVCASVPVFWPMLSQQWGKILVTQEVVITTERRRQVPVDSRHDNDDEDDLFELTHSRQDSNGSNSIGYAESRRGKNNHHNRQGPSQLPPLPGKGLSLEFGEEVYAVVEQAEKSPRKMPSRAEIHYSDDYIMGQVDPLHAERPVQAHVRSNLKRKTKRQKEGGSSGSKSKFVWLP